MDKALTKMAKGIGVFVLLAIFTTPMVLLAAWPVMLALGVVHNDLTTQVPALGFWATFVLLWGGRMLLGVVRSTGAKE